MLPGCRARARPGTASRSTRSWNADDLAAAHARRRSPRPGPGAGRRPVGVGLGQLAERAVGEGDGDAVVVGDGLGVEARASASSADEGVDAGHAPRSTRAARGRALLAAGLDGVVGRRAPAAAARRSSMRASDGERRRLEAERRGVGGQRVAVLRPPDARRGCRSRPRAGRPRACARGGGARCWGAGRASRRSRRWPAARGERASSR